jgi:hypothetical protein
LNKWFSSSWKDEVNQGAILRFSKEGLRIFYFMTFCIKTKEKVQGEDLPFRIGTPAYIYNEDILGNVYRLKDKVNELTH